MKYRRSKLQKRILEVLKDYKPKSQSQIARLIGAHPSSVSRSMNKLVKQGAIIKKGSVYRKRGVSIEDLSVRSRAAKTPEIYPDNNTIDHNRRRTAVSTFDHLFHKNLEEYNRGFSRMVDMLNETPAKRFEELVNRLDQQLKPLHHLEDILNTINIATLDIPTVSEFATLQDTSVDLGTLNDLKVDLGNLNELKSAVEGLQSSEELLNLKDQIHNLGEITRIGSSTLEKLSSMKIEFDEFTNLQNRLGSSIENSINNYQIGLDSILSTDLEKIYKLKSSIYEGELVNAVKGLTINMDEYVKSSIGFGMEHVLLKEPYLIKDLELNSLIFKDIGHSFHELTYFPSDTREDQDQEPDIADLEDEYELEDLLNDLNPNYARKYNGTLHALTSDSPDGISQAAHSLRELHEHIIRDYAPDEEVRNYKGLDNNTKIHRSHRVEFIFRDKSKSENKLVTSFTETWVLLVDHHIKVCHTGEFQTNWLRMKHTIMMSETMIYELCIQIKKSNNK